MMGGGLFNMMFFGLLIIILIIALVAWFWDKGRITTQPKSQTPLDILKERYAKGEIAEKEFQRKKEQLKG